MNINNFILGLMFFIASTLVILTLVFDLYSTNGYDIDLDNDNYTSFLSDLQDEAELAQTNTESASNNIWDKTPGQSDADFESGEVSEGDMIQSGYRALTSIGSYVDVFISLMRESFKAVSLDESPIFWFFISGIIISIGLLLINAVVRNII